MRRVPEVILSVFFAFYLFIRYIEYKMFLLNTLDFAIFYESARNFALHGTFFNKPEYYYHGVSTHFGVHFQPIMVVYSLVYKITPSQYVMATIDLVFWFIAGFEIIYFARKLGKNPMPAILFWIFAPAAQYWIFDIHPMNLVVVFIIPLLYYAYVGDYVKATLFGFLTLMGKEDAGMIIIGLGVYEYLIGNKRKAIIYGAIGSLAILISIEITTMIGGRYIYTGRFVGSSVALQQVGIISFAVLVITSGVLFLKDKEQVFLYGILAPILVEDFLSSKVEQVTFGFQYFSYISAIIAFILIVAELKRVRTYAATLLIMSLLISPVFNVVFMIDPQENDFAHYHGLPLFNISVFDYLPAYIDQKSDVESFSNFMHEEIERNTSTTYYLDNDLYYPYCTMSNVFPTAALRTGTTIGTCNNCTVILSSRSVHYYVAPQQYSNETILLTTNKHEHAYYVINTHT